MSETRNGGSHSRKRSHTVIGANLRVEGTVEFSGDLILRGHVIGDISSLPDSHSTLVVERSGSMSGKTTAQVIDIKGSNHGPLHASHALEIHAGATSVGDTEYKTLRIHHGGTLVGLLTPIAAATTPTSAQPETTALQSIPQAGKPFESALAAAPVAARAKPGVSPTIDRYSEKPSRAGVWGIALLLAVAAVIGFLWVQDRPARPIAVSPELPMQTSAPLKPAPAASDADRAAAKNEVKAKEAQKSETTKPTTPAKHDEKPKAPPPSKAEVVERPEPDINDVAAIQGANPNKPADRIYIITKAPAVLYKKKAGDSSRGTRLEFGKGRNTGIRIAQDELLRVALGESLDLYYQGGKVWANPVDRGVWMRFEAVTPPPEAKPAPSVTPAPAANMPAPAPAASTPVPATLSSDGKGSAVMQPAKVQ